MLVNTDHETLELVVTPPLAHGTVAAPHNSVTIVPVPVIAPANVVSLTPEVGVQPGAVVIVATQHPVIHPPPVPVLEPPVSSMAPVGKPACRLAKLISNKCCSSDLGSFT